MSNLNNNGIDDPLECQIINEMKKKDYSLDTVNKYGDNLLHVSAANGFYTLIEKILKKHDSEEVDLQNDSGWTPLMQAIRNRNVETVKLLLANGCNPEQSANQDISAIALAVAISREMFELVYEACPTALKISKNDTISPLCVAAMKNDKEMFFRLLDLGLKLSEASDYTLLMMAQSTVPEIASLGESQNENANHWNEDMSHDIFESFSEDDFIVPKMSSTLQDAENFSDQDSRENLGEAGISVVINPPTGRSNFEKRRNSAPMVFHFDSRVSKNFISPKLEYTREVTLAKSPNVCFRKRESANDSGFETKFKINHDRKKNKRNEESNFEKNPMKPYQMKRPPNLTIPKLEYFKKSRETSRDVVSSPANTPTELPCEKPLPTMAMDIHQQKMASVLKFFGLAKFIPIFIEQEVDLDLFLMLTDQDLQEIGIETKSDRIIILSVVDECVRTRFFK